MAQFHFPLIGRVHHYDSRLFDHPIGNRSSKSEVISFSCIISEWISNFFLLFHLPILLSTISRYKLNRLNVTDVNPIYYLTFNGFVIKITSH